MDERIRRLLVAESASLFEAMSAIDAGAHGIALVVKPDGRLIGTLTDGDIRRAVLSGASLDASCSEFANRRFTGVSPGTGRAEVLDLMKARTLRHIPIIDQDGRLTGVHMLREMLGTVDRPNWAVVMAGGRGERLRPITDSIPKPMVHVAGRPILERIVLHLVGFGITRMFLAVNYMSDVIEAHFNDGSTFGCRIDYLREDAPLGTGGALSLLPEEPADPLIVLNGDLLTQVDVGSMLGFHSDGGFKATIGLRDYVHRVPFGVVEMDGTSVTDIREKPTHAWTANCGVYVIQPELVTRIPRSQIFTMPDLMGDCLKRGEPVGGYMVEGDWMDIGRPRELRRARGEDAAP